MAFKLLEKGQFTIREALPEGWASINRCGTIRLHKEDLDLVGIDGVAVILTDELTLRLAIRKPKPNEGRNAYRVAPCPAFGKVEKGHRQICIKRALNELRIDPPTAAGRYEIMTKDDLLIISLAGIGEKDQAADKEDERDEE